MNSAAFLMALALVCPQPAQSQVDAGQSTVKQRQTYNNPPGPIRQCTCDDIPALQDFLENSEYAIREFETAAVNRKNMEDSGGPPHISNREYDALTNSFDQGAPGNRFGHVGGASTSQDASCAIDDDPIHKTAPCQAVYEAFRDHERYHQQVCLAIWKDQKQAPPAVQKGSEVLQEEAEGYKIAANVYRRTLEALLERAVIGVSYTLEDGSRPSGFNARFEAQLAAPGATQPDGKVEWIARRPMRFTKVEHFAGKESRGCKAPDFERDDTLSAVTRDFRTLEFFHKSGPEDAQFKCNYNAKFNTALPALMADTWRQYLIANTLFELSSFGGLSGMPLQLAPVSGARPPGFTGLPGFGTPTAGLPPFIAAMLGKASAPPFASRNAWPWPPVTARVRNGGVSTFPPQDGGRSELYIDDFADTAGTKITTKIVLTCPPGP
jgi:hypothetical protein